MVYHRKFVKMLNKFLNFASCSNMPASVLPYYTCGEIIKGFGRGSAELGIPTANYPSSVVNKLPEELPTGIYYGFASIDNGDVHKMVMSIGWNPFYENKQKSMETHIMHKFNRNLYGCLLKVCIVGYLRPEKNFDSLDALIEAINNDIANADKLLNEFPAAAYKLSNFFRSSYISNSDSKNNR